MGSNCTKIIATYEKSDEPVDLVEKKSQFISEDFSKSKESNKKMVHDFESR